VAPTVSILTPSYNYAHFIGDALTSVVRQDTRWQHVVVDGASTDATLDIVAAAPAGRRVVVSEPDLGQSDALNKAIAMADGEWIGWLNADEFYLPRTQQIVERAIADHPDVDVLYGDAVFVDRAGNFLEVFAQHRPRKIVQRHYEPTNASCATFFRRAVLGEQPWSLDFRVAMDWDLYLRLIDAGARFRHVRAPVGCFRIHGAQVTSVKTPEDELRRLRQAHRLTLRPRARRLLWRTGRYVHGAWKAIDGGFRVERCSAKLVGRSLRWFDDDGEAATNTAVLYSCYGR